jgi:ribosome biogenesis GTPase
MPYEREIRIKGIKSTNPIAVGDVVDYELKNPRILLQEPFTTSTKEKIILSVSRLIYPIRCILLHLILIVFFIDNNKQSAYYFNFIDRFL